MTIKIRNIFKYFLTRSAIVERFLRISYFKVKWFWFFLVHKIRRNFILYVSGDQSRFFILVDNLNLLPKKHYFFPALNQIKTDKKIFLSVKIPHIESLSNPDIVARKEFIDALNLHPNLQILYDLSTEAITFSGYTSDIMRKFHYLLQSSAIDSRRVYFLCANANASYAYELWLRKHKVNNPICLMGYNFYLFEYLWEVKKCDWFINNRKILLEKTLQTLAGVKRDKYFLCLNLRPRSHRTAIVLHLLERNYLNKGCVTYFGEEFGSTDTDSVENLATTIAFIKQLKSGERLLPHLQTLQNMAPLQFDRNSGQMRKDLWVRKPGQVEFLIPEASKLAQGIKTYFEIITETWFTDDSNLYITEKTIRPILRFQLFIHVGAPFVLKKLKEMGFQTFSPFIDESYDDIINPVERMEKIFVEIDRLCNMSFNEIHELYCVLWPRL